MKDIRLLEANEIECRVGQQSKGEAKWVTLLLYKDARCDYKILDEVFGVLGWQAEYQAINGKMYCTISLWDAENKQWVRKQNVGTESNMEAVKGEASDALKRAAFAVGIGRELYTAPRIKINLTESDLWNGVMVAKFEVSEIGYDKNRQINHLVIVDNRGQERFRMGAKVSTPKASTSKTSAIKARLNEAIQALQQAKTPDEARTLYTTTFADLKRKGNDDTDPYRKQWFDAVTARGMELMSNNNK